MRVPPELGGALSKSHSAQHSRGLKTRTLNLGLYLLLTNPKASVSLYVKRSEVACPDNLPRRCTQQCFGKAKHSVEWEGSVSGNSRQNESNGQRPVRRIRVGPGQEGGKHPDAG